MICFLVWVPALSALCNDQRCPRFAMTLIQRRRSAFHICACDHLQIPQDKRTNLARKVQRLSQLWYMAVAARLWGILAQANQFPSVDNGFALQASMWVHSHMRKMERFRTYVIPPICVLVEMWRLAQQYATRSYASDSRFVHLSNVIRIDKG